MQRFAEAELEAWRDHTRTPIVPGKTLLLLDEVQAAPAVLAKLRYLAEELPDLHVIAAGSLLDFTLQSHTFSMPVGRISYLHLEPMTFEEVLLARGEDRLRELLMTLAPGESIPQALHVRLLELVRAHLYCGGMPAAVKLFVETGSFLEVQRTQHDLLATVRDATAGSWPNSSSDRSCARLARRIRSLRCTIGRGSSVHRAPKWIT